MKQFTKKDKTKIVAYYWKKVDEYKHLSDEELQVINKEGKHKDKKLSSTEVLAVEYVMSDRRKQALNNTEPATTGYSEVVSTTEGDVDFSEVVAEDSQ